MPESPEQHVESYLRSGDHDAIFLGWPGNNLFARSRNGHAALSRALIAEVRARTPNAAVPESLSNMDAVAFTRGKVAPMVRGLFSADEQAAVLDMLGRSVVFLTPATIDAVLERQAWLGTAWNLANLYLESFDAELLAEDAPRLVGLSEETTCYLSAAYFGAEGRFDDFLVHEAAHIFHNCKRHTIRLRETRKREWLLEIDFTKRETFAYACEAYSRICELGENLRARRTLLSGHEQELQPPDERVNAVEYLSILREAVSPQWLEAHPAAVFAPSFPSSFQ
jgi:hypothetical protein